VTQPWSILVRDPHAETAGAPRLWNLALPAASSAMGCSPTKHRKFISKHWQRPEISSAKTIGKGQLTKNIGLNQPKKGKNTTKLPAMSPVLGYDPWWHYALPATGCSSDMMI
jgi:hypothetical protein